MVYGELVIHSPYLELLFFLLPRRVLTSSRFDMPFDKETKYNVLIYGPWGFQKCIWEPNFTKAKFHSKNVLS